MVSILTICQQFFHDVSQTCPDQLFVNLSLEVASGEYGLESIGGNWTFGSC